jgi:hypothetical protein
MTLFINATLVPFCALVDAVEQVAYYNVLGETVLPLLGANYWCGTRLNRQPNR